MKIIHCADLHLDSNMTSNLTGEKAKERKSELLMTFNKMIQYAQDNEVQAVLIAGDLFDKKKVSKTALSIVRQAIVMHPQIEFYYLQGNHDVDSLIGDMEKIPDNLKLFGDTWTSYHIAGKENTEASYGEGAAEAASGNAPVSVTISGVELSADNAGSIYDSLVLNHDCFNIVMLHGQEAEHASKDKTEVINIRRLKNKGIDYLALGHIHSYKEEALDNRGVYCYSGCLEGRGFDECGEHGFVLMDIDEKSHSCERTFVPFAGRKIYSVEINVANCMTTMDVIERINEELALNMYPESSLMKLILVGEVDVECEKDIVYITKQFEDRFYFLKIYDETKLHVDYDDYALDVSLKGEFVRTIRQEDTLSEEEKADIIRCGIRILAGEEV